MADAVRSSLAEILAALRAVRSRRAEIHEPSECCVIVTGCFGKDAGLRDREDGCSFSGECGACDDRIVAIDRSERSESSEGGERGVGCAGGEGGEGGEAVLVGEAECIVGLSVAW